MLEVHHLYQYYSKKDPQKDSSKDFFSLQDISFSVAKGSLVLLLGPSGSGKTTLLKCLAGIEPLSKGTIRLQTTEIHSLPSYQRNISLFFQDLALWPHWSVRKTLQEVAKRNNGLPQMSYWIDIFELSSLLDRKPYELSGGEAQRVALARALLVQPELLLLDEPFANLNVSLREHSRRKIEQVLKKHQITSLIVSHDPQDLSIADEVLILIRGKLVAQNTPEQLYKNPLTSEIAQLFGPINLFEGTRQNTETLATPFGSFSYPTLKNSKYRLGLWPEAIQPHSNGLFEGKITQQRFFPREKKMLHFMFQEQEFFTWIDPITLPNPFRFNLSSPPLLFDPIL